MMINNNITTTQDYIIFLRIVESLKLSTIMQTAYNKKVENNAQHHSFYKMQPIKKNFYPSIQRNVMYIQRYEQG